jgi:hypothetical protein
MPALFDYNVACFTKYVYSRIVLQSEAALILGSGSFIVESTPACSRVVPVVAAVGGCSGGRQWFGLHAFMASESDSSQAGPCSTYRST